MANLQVPDYLESGLEASAARRGRTVEQLIEEIVATHIEQEFPAPENFTDDEIAHFKLSVAQLDRGERISSEEVGEFFKKLHVRLASR